MKFDYEDLRIISVQLLQPNSNYSFLLLSSSSNYFLPLRTLSEGYNSASGIRTRSHGPPSDHSTTWPIFFIQKVSLWFMGTSATNTLVDNYFIKLPQQDDLTSKLSQRFHEKKISCWHQDLNPPLSITFLLAWDLLSLHELTFSYFVPVGSQSSGALKAAIKTTPMLIGNIDQCLYYIL